MSETTLWLVRHAETEWNQQGRMQGHQDSQLTEAGFVHARAVARRLMTVEPAVIYTSDLGRAVRTADEIAAATEAALVRDRTLREKNNGIFEGLTRDEVAARYPDIYARYGQRDPDFIIPNGESMTQVQTRAVETLGRLAGDHPDEALIVVSHGGFLGGFVRYLLGIPLSAHWRFRLDNCGISTVRYRHEEADPWHLVTLNDVGHLQASRPRRTLRLLDNR